jgi:hypothetical protein
VLPFYGGVELALEVCPEHREVVERSIEAVDEVVWKAGLDPVGPSTVACWAGKAS